MNVDALGKRFLKYKLVSIVILLGGAVIALANFANAIQQIGRSIPWPFGDVDSADVTKKKISNLLGDVEKMSVEEARHNLTTVEDCVAKLKTSEAKQAALRELVVIIFYGPTRSAEMRPIRKMVMASIIRMQGRNLAKLFEERQLEGSELEQIDFSKTILTNVSFAGAALCETSFEGAVLNHANLNAAFLRNAKFAGASVVDTNFEKADWFNATGLTLRQLQSAKTTSLQRCPGSKKEMMEYLWAYHEVSFNYLADEVQAELENNWNKYWSKGLAATVAQWNP
jgi:uncharacterized protein YjbI with pentapeptide repeats